MQPRLELGTWVLESPESVGSNVQPNITAIAPARPGKPM